MLGIDFFSRLGLFIKEDFLDDELCAKLLAQTSFAESEPVLVVTKSEDNLLVPQFSKDKRQTEEIKITDNEKFFLKKSLLDIKSRLEQHFDLELKDCQNPLFYRYKEGDFFGAHQDNSEQPDAPDFLKERRISTIIFLNEMSEEPTPETYGGGDLTFYGLIDNPQWQEYGFNFPGKPGMLVAFPSHVYHEVKAVTHGHRYTVVSWFI
jgi:SM-20-related protein